jgi:glucose/arabinose dehydrogenase
MTFVTGDEYPAWKGNVLVGSLKFQYLVRCELEGEKVVHQEKLLEGYGRVRNVQQGPDGYIYVALEGTGLIVKLVPSET